MKTGWVTIVAAVPLVLAVPVRVLVTFALALPKAPRELRGTFRKERAVFKL